MSKAALVAVAQEATARGPALLVAFRLADRTNRYGWAWPSVPTLVDDTGLSRSTVLRALKELEDLGELFVERSRSRRGNRYRLRLRGVPGSDITEAADGPGTVSQGDRSEIRNGVTTPPERSHRPPGTVSRRHPNLENLQNLAAPPREACSLCDGSLWVMPAGESAVHPCPRCQP